jgi:GNAT superfamily N-acetyltransferase
MTARAPWRPMRFVDLPEVERIADVVHADFPERPEVLAERLALFPAGCLVTDGGYAVAHPAILGRPPALDTLLGALPDGAETLHVHDVALLPSVQRLGLGGAALRAVVAVAVRHGLAWLSLVAIHGTPPYWARFGFIEAPASDALASYGAEARYMVRPVVF